jgi:hypothetical protein
MHCTIIIIKTKEFFNTGGTRKSNNNNYKLTFSNTLFVKVQQLRLFRRRSAWL